MYCDGLLVSDDLRLFKGSRRNVRYQPMSDGLPPAGLLLMSRKHRPQVSASRATSTLTRLGTVVFEICTTVQIVKTLRGHVVTIPLFGVPTILTVIATTEVPILCVTNGYSQTK
jgi:hypothetical protein